MNYPIFDLHCDTAYAILSHEDRMVDKRLKSNQLHIDLERASKLPGYCQCFACFTTPLEQLPPKMSVIDLFERELNGIINEIGKNLEDKFGINYLCADFKKRNGYKMSLELFKKYNLYRQDYCGCKYSYLVKEKIKLEK